MVTEAAIIELMEEYKDTPEAGEAAYLVAQELNPSQIAENLSQRYGSGQGYAQFKEDITEMTGFTVDDSSGFRLLSEDGEHRFRDVTADDVGAPLDGRIRHAFLEEIEPMLRDQLLERLPELNDDAGLVAGIARQGYEVGLWEHDARTQTIWDCCALFNEKVLTDREQSDILEALTTAGCIYNTGGSIRLTPMLAKLDNPDKHLPLLTQMWPDNQH